MLVALVLILAKDKQKRRKTMGFFKSITKSFERATLDRVIRNTTSNPKVKRAIDRDRAQRRPTKTR